MWVFLFLSYSNPSDFVNFGMSFFSRMYVSIAHDYSSWIRRECIMNDWVMRYREWDDIEKRK